jgi:hypothetical protein
MMSSRLFPFMSLLLTVSAACAQDEAYFRDKVYPVLQKAGCPACHNPDGVASATRLQFPEGKATPAQIDAFGRSLQPLVDRNNPSHSLLLQKPTVRVAHAGGKRIAPGSSEEGVLKGWVAYLASHDFATQQSGTDVAGAAAPILRRLTHAEYNRTVRDLLGDESRPADAFPPEDFVNGFKNQYQAQSTSPLLAEAYSAAAEKLAKNAFRGGDRLGLIPCKPSGPGDAACRAKFIRSFGRRAFRRPLLDTEVNRYTALFDRQARQYRDFLAGAQIVVEAMLTSPNFLFRVENGADPRWRPYETASKMSYFLWDSMPDEALLHSAETGELNSPAGVERVARRMLDNPKAHEAIDEFTAQWLRFDRVLGTVRDRRLFPSFTVELSVAMTEETRRLVSDLVWNDGDFRKVFNADYSFLTSDLAALYGLPAPDKEFGKVQIPPERERAGILGQGTFLTLTSKPADTSPTARGLFVREQFLCQEVPPPPPGVNTNLPVSTAEKPMTNRDRMAIHLTSETCASCHRLIDPIGFGLEKFDAVGQRRDKLKLTFFPTRAEKKKESVTVELPLNTAGEIAGIPDSSFSSPRELGNVLANARQCQECVARQLFRYANGRHETPEDRAVIRQAFQDFQRSGFKFKELIVSLTKWSVFPQGRKESDAVGFD